MIAYPDNSNQALSYIWHVGFVPGREDFLALMEDIDGPRRRDRQRFISFAARVGARADFSVNNYALSWPAGFAVDVDGLMLDWASQSFDGSQATGGQIGSTEPTTSGQKTLLMFGVKHEYTEDTPVTDRKGVVQQTRRVSRAVPVVYRLAGQVAEAEDLLANASFKAMVDEAINADKVVPLVFAQRRHGSSAFTDDDLFRYERYIYTSVNASNAGQNEEAALSRAFASTGRVLTPNGQVAYTSQAVSGTGGEVQLTGGESIDLSVGARGEEGAYRQYARIVRALEAQTFALDANQKYVIRAKISDDGDLIAYKALTDVAYPDTSQSPALFATSSSGANDGAFWTTARDIALLEVQTGDAGTAPLIVPLASTPMSHLYFLLGAAYFQGDSVSFSTGNFSGNVETQGGIITQDISTFNEDLNVDPEFKITTARIEHPDGSDGEFALVGDVTVNLLTTLLGLTSNGTINITSNFTANLHGVGTNGFLIEGERDDETVPNGGRYIEILAVGSDLQGGGDRASMAIFADGDQGGTAYQLDLSPDGAFNKRPVVRVSKNGIQYHYGFYDGVAALHIGRVARSRGNDIASPSNMSSLEGDGYADVFASGNLSLEYAAIGGEAKSGQGVLSLWSNPTGSVKVKGAQVRGNVMVSDTVPVAALALRRDTGNNRYDIINNTGFATTTIDNDLSNHQGASTARIEVTLLEDIGEDCTVVVTGGSSTEPWIGHGFVTVDGGSSYVTALLDDSAGASKTGTAAPDNSTVNIIVMKSGRLL